ncbi:MAG TPA: L-threonylcarbamoyladenylate synthase [archaeon]|nr:L-threonylcarbamoyladenylate synthase [archaeon]
MAYPFKSWLTLIPITLLHGRRPLFKIAKATNGAIHEAAKIIMNGGLVVYPTDTVYGLGCDPLNIQSVRLLMKAKSRDGKPLPILASSIKKAEKVAYFNKNASKIARKFWPGAVTLVLRKKPLISTTVTCGSRSIGVRVPKDDVALKLIRLSGGFIIGTSANITGRKSPRTAIEAANQVGKYVDLILDAGPTNIGEDSTVIDVTSERPQILRAGPIKVRDIAKTLRVKLT